MSDLVFLPTYRETVTVSDGDRLDVRLIQAADKSKLEAGFQRLSSDSRFFRFFSHKPALTAQDLNFFTEFDGTNHAALGAFELDPVGAEGDTVGVSRFVRVHDSSAEAEFSLAVADDQQGKGLGCLLMERLLLMAAERGVERLHGYLHPMNERIVGLLRRVCRAVSFSREDGMIKATLPLAGCLQAEVMI